jgi:hypothetical protein
LATRIKVLQGVGEKRLLSTIVDRAIDQRRKVEKWRDACGFVSK